MCSVARGVRFDANLIVEKIILLLLIQLKFEHRVKFCSFSGMSRG